MVRKAVTWNIVVVVVIQVLLRSTTNLAYYITLNNRRCFHINHCLSTSSSSSYQRQYKHNNNNNRNIQLYSGLEPLVTEGDWTAYLDEENTGLIYYFNGKTGISVWEKPTLTFPDVVLRGSMKRIAIERQEIYLQSVVAKEIKDDNTKKGFFQSILETTTTSDDTTSTSNNIKKDEKDWFSWNNDLSATTTITSSSPDTRIEEKVVVEKQQQQQQQTKDESKEKGFFDTLFGSSTATKEVEKVKEVEKPAVDVGGFFGSIFKTVATTETPTTSTTTNVDDKATTTVPSTVTTTTTTTTTKTPVKIDSAAYVLPHPSKIFWGGEDAVFIQGRTFGVFDGVSGAKKLDGIPLYSKTLAKEMKKLIPNNNDQASALSTPDLTRLLTQCSDVANQIATGASTAVVASIGMDGYLRAINVGDSTCIVVRDGKIVAKTREISHYFECPYQLSIDSPDKPKDGTKLNVELVPGDIVFMASDGVFDNLFETDVAEMIQKERKQLSQVAKRISDMSRKVSQDRFAKTPYAKLAQKYGDPEYQSGLGGKVDDVSCVVVAYG